MISRILPTLVARWMICQGKMVPLAGIQPPNIWSSRPFSHIHIHFQPIDNVLQWISAPSIRIQPMLYLGVY